MIQLNQLKGKGLGTSMQYKNYQEAIENVDWELLKQQKKTLEKLLSISPFDVKTLDIYTKNLSDLWGLIELIENLQDVHDP
jgi:hypothetical protein